MGKNNTQTYEFAKSFLGKGGATFRSYCGLPNGAAWCDAYVTYIFHKTDNASLFCSGKKQTYCPTTIKIIRKEMAQIPPYLAMPMDVIFFDWDRNGVPNHIGFVREKYSTDTILTIEGNTNGSVVAHKSRSTKYVCGVFRPHFKPTYKLGKLVVDGDCGYNTIAGIQKLVNAPVDAILGIGTVKKVQAYCGAKQDGAWGADTSRKLQAKMAKEGYYTGKIDGAFGKQSVTGFQRMINAKCFSNSATAKPSVKPVAKPKPTTPTRAKMKAIGHARADYDHKAGDSTGKEVLRSKFVYNSSSGSVYNWTYVFRPKDLSKAEKAAAMCEKAIANNNIGYCSKGETAYGKAKAMTKLAKAVKYDLSKIKTKCGCSCGDLICLCNHWAGLSTCYIGSGKQLAESYRKNSNFQTIKYSKGMQLYRGDVLITAHANGKHNHVVMCL